MTVPSRLFATHSAVGVARTAAGPSPTGVVPATAFVSVSTRTSALSPAFATQAPAALTATAAGPLPTGIVFVTSVAGVDARDGAVGAVRHPHGARAGRDRRGSVSDGDGLHDARGTGVDSQDDAVGADDPERPERRERRPQPFRRRTRRRHERPRGGETVVPRVDLRDSAGAVGHPDAGRSWRRSPSACRRSECSARPVATTRRPSSRSGRRGSRPTARLRPTRSRPVEPRPETVAAIEPDGSRATIEFAAHGCRRRARRRSVPRRRPRLPRAVAATAATPATRAAVTVNRRAAGAASAAASRWWHVWLRRCPAAASRRLEQAAVDRLGLGRRVGAELLREQPSAPLVHLERLRAVAGGGVRLHQAPVSGLAKRLEGDRLLGPAHRLRRSHPTQATRPPGRQRAATNVCELTPLLLDPAPSSPGRKGCRTSDAASAAAPSPAPGRPRASASSASRAASAAATTSTQVPAGSSSR